MVADFEPRGPIFYYPFSGTILSTTGPTDLWNVTAPSNLQTSDPTKAASQIDGTLTVKMLVLLKMDNARQRCRHGSASLIEAATLRHGRRCAATRTARRWER